MASAIIFGTKTISGNQPIMRRLPEKAGQTFLLGVPVMSEVASGTVVEWDGTTVALGIAGISKEPASNLATAGIINPSLATLLGATMSFGSVPFEASAANIPRGAPLNDGRIGVEIASDDTVFQAQIGPAQTLAATDLYKQYGMTKDSDGHWYVDKTKSTVGTNTVCQIVDLDDYDTVRGVRIVIARAAAQVLA